MYKKYTSIVAYADDEDTSRIKTELNIFKNEKNPPVDFIPTFREYIDEKLNELKSKSKGMKIFAEGYGCEPEPIFIKNYRELKRTTLDEILTRVEKALDDLNSRF